LEDAIRYVIVIERFSSRLTLIFLIGSPMARMELSGSVHARTFASAERFNEEVDEYAYQWRRSLAWRVSDRVLPVLPLHYDVPSPAAIQPV
jgi:hypothetical protein